MLNKLLSDGNSSRLNVELVEKSQKCVYAGAFTFNLEDPGLTLAFAMANSGENPKEIEQLMDIEYEKLKSSKSKILFQHGLLKKYEGMIK